MKPFEGHPYKVIDNEEMDALVESIREHGIMTPLIVRRIGDDRYEIISGHRRAHAAELAGLVTVPAIEMEMTRDEAAIALVDSNLHRERLLPSEKAFAYKLKLELFPDRAEGQIYLRDKLSHRPTIQLPANLSGSRAAAILKARIWSQIPTADGRCSAISASLTLSPLCSIWSMISESRSL